MRSASATAPEMEWTESHPATPADPPGELAPPVGHPTARPSVTRLRPERLLSYIAASAASNRLSFKPGMLVAARFKEQKPKLAVTDRG